VLVHFSKRTELDDYVGAAYKKAARIHRELPPGGILIFMTGQREVQQLSARLKRMFPGQHRAEVPGGAAVGAADMDAQETDAQGDNVADVDGADRAEIDADLLDSRDALGVYSSCP
jgi:ATP-dependent RNA helicase DHX37/DHR1